MSQTQNSGVQLLVVDAERQGQRLDNFLMLHLKGVPKGHLYKLVRSGQVRINGKRCKPDSRLQADDTVRLPPVVTRMDAQVPPLADRLRQLLLQSVVFEDEALLVLNKPPGLAVHGGSGVQMGLIEAARQAWPAVRFLELVHRIDRDTSGIIMLAKKRSALRHMHEQLRLHRMRKAYDCLVFGSWPLKLKQVEAPLDRQTRASGERVVRVSAEGQSAKTLFKIKANFAEATWLQASPVSGRTHQIRVHCQHAGHAILGDEKYCPDFILNAFKAKQVRRLCLHAAKIEFEHPVTGERLELEAPMPDDMQAVLKQLSSP